MEKPIKVFYIDSIISNKKRIKYVALEGLCADIENEYVIKCRDDIESIMNYKDHVISSPFTPDKTILEFLKKLKILREGFDDKEIIEKFI